MSFVRFHLDNSKVINVTASATAGLDTLSPFIRFFPRDTPGHSGFYFQYTHSLLRLRFDVPATVKVTVGVSDLSLSTTGQIVAKATVIQSLPTISIGNIWRSKMLFANLSLGATFLYTTYASADINGIMPDAIGTAEDRKKALDQVKSQLTDNVNDKLSPFKKQIFLIPSIFMSVGFIF